MQESRMTNPLGLQWVSVDEGGRSHLEMRWVPSMATSSPTVAPVAPAASVAAAPVPADTVPSAATITGAVRAA